jgi:hypothetical protein
VHTGPFLGTLESYQAESTDAWASVWERCYAQRAAGSLGARHQFTGVELGTSVWLQLVSECRDDVRLAIVFVRT